MAQRTAFSIASRCQNRHVEKLYFRRLGIPTTDFVFIPKGTDIMRTVAGSTVRFPAVLKTACGHNGHRIADVPTADVLAEIYRGFSDEDCLLESRVHYDQEFCIVIARSEAGMSAYPAIRTEYHHNSMLMGVAYTDGWLNRDLQRQAWAMAAKFADHFGIEDVMTMKFFLAGNRKEPVYGVVPDFRKERSGSKVLANGVVPGAYKALDMVPEFDVPTQTEQLTAIRQGLPPLRTDLGRIAAIERGLPKALWTHEQPAVAA